MQVLALDPTAASLLIWVAGSVAIYGLAANALWLARRAWARRALRSRDEHAPTDSAAQPAPIEPAPSRAGLRRAWPGVAAWLCEAGSLLFFFGIPYLALGGWPRRPLQGVISLTDLGLAGLGGLWSVQRWLQAAGTGAGLGALALAVLLVALANANRPAAGIRLRFRPRPWWAVVIDVIALQVHWAFYRACLALLLGDVERGVVAGLGAVYLEWASSPFWRRDWREAARAPDQWLRAALALVVASIFMMTHNLWVCAGVHLLLELACRGAARDRDRVALQTRPA